MADPTSSERTWPHLESPPHVITATGENGITPFSWDPTSNEAVGIWESVDPQSGIAGPDGAVTQEFPDTGKWKQT